MTSEVMPVDVQNREDQLLGAAWRRCQQAAEVDDLMWGISYDDDTFTVWADVTLPDRTMLVFRNDDPAAALDALTEALANR